MQLREATPDTQGDQDLSLLWPSNHADDVLRRHLAAVLLDDPDHRLRVAHLEPLLQLSVGSEAACSSGRLQALLTDPETATIFPVDFASTKVADWRSRVVHLDIVQLATYIATARHQQAEQQQLQDPYNVAVIVHSGHCAAGINGSSKAVEAGLQKSDADPFAKSNSTGTSQHTPQHAQPAVGSFSQQPLMLETIFSASPVFRRGFSQGPMAITGANRVDCPLSSSAQALAGSYGAGDSSSRGGGVSLFGSSFEVPHAIASCWAGPSSCGSGMGSVGTTAPAAASNSGVGIRQAGTDDAHDAAQNCGGSSTASGSSSYSIAAASRAAASRLRKATATVTDTDVGSAGRQLSTVCSSGALSGILDVCTPRSALAANDTSASPENSSAAEDDIEYNEAQLLFGLAGAAAGKPTGGSAASNGKAPSTSSGAATEQTPSLGVDWAKFTAFQQQQQQPQNSQDAWQYQHQSYPSAQQQGLLSAFVGAGGAHSPWSAQHPSIAEAAVTLFTGTSGIAPRGGVSAGSASMVGNSSAVQDLLLQLEPGMFGAGGSTAAVTAAQLAESVLLDADRQFSIPQMLFTAHSGSYSSGGMLQSSNSTHYRGTGSGVQSYNSAGYQQQGHPNHGSLDIGARSDQHKDASAVKLDGMPLKAVNQRAEVMGTVPRKDVSSSAAEGNGSSGSTSSAADNAASIPASGAPAVAVPKLTGWASIAARDPKTSPVTPSAAVSHSNIVGTPVSSSGSGVMHSSQTRLGSCSGIAASGVSSVGPAAAAAAAKGLSSEPGKAIYRLPARVRSEVLALIAQFDGVLKVDDIDDGIVHQLNTKRSEGEAVAAVRHIANYDLANIQHMAAYLNHLVKHYNHAAASESGNTSAAHMAVNGMSGMGSTGSANGSSISQSVLLGQQPSSLGSTLGGSGKSNSGSGATAGAAAGGSSLGAYGGQIRLASVPVSTKSMLQKLPLKVFKQLEQLVAKCAYLEWRHFDAGVVKVGQQRTQCVCSFSAPQSVAHLSRKSPFACHR
eukprot:GHRR01002410.1.p1 GENE.GHRR01002410.1~~GHRR01002410.1.p1  ORF type:complete len:1011 (+),score=410.17 GHRR01002410.1:278-3310(+)